MPFLKDAIEDVSKKIHDACPDVVLDTRKDRGLLQLVGYKRDAHGMVLPETLRVILQPARHEENQPAIVASTDTLIKFWST